MYTKMYEKTICTSIYMVYTKNYYFSFVHSCLYLSCTWYVLCQFLLKKLHTLKMQIHSLNVLNLSLASMYSIRTRMNRVHTMLVNRNQHFCTYQVHTRIYTLRMALAGGQLSWGISAKTCLAAFVSVCRWTDHAE